jgi:hypothetical protein
MTSRERMGFEPMAVHSVTPEAEIIKKLYELEIV